ncbi:hypothetical protein G3485_00025 [Shewanella baltica]|uniref:hypothetical protein n=1 Tax=Shewanella baltica TaxID=62322 RepID=UPI00217DA282|nr:hypothetical protein [Shewanella baltica]MCS6126607.1 hypothetical protein [Shewanella baltica]MCS6137928.1 hypothetical protein [Shewanella baltica]MCS6144555.1 hypothetical protein [Shewanella baltica]MCS6169083.1 hypothetical protein [Shewanella baltica]MCS6186623.1 hypothetical protein [Shewanella baltica]
MKVEIERTEDGEAFFRLPDEYLADLKWQDGDVIEWIDNKDGTWTLRKSSVQVLRISHAPFLVSKVASS